MSEYRNDNYSLTQRLVDGARNLGYSALVAGALVGLPGCAASHGAREISVDLKDLHSQLTYEHNRNKAVNRTLNKILNDRLPDVSEPDRTKIKNNVQSYKENLDKKKAFQITFTPNEERTNLDLDDITGVDSDYSTEFVPKTNVVLGYNDQGHLISVTYQTRSQGTFPREGDDETENVTQYAKTTVDFNVKPPVATILYFGTNKPSEESQPLVTAKVYLKDGEALRTSIFNDGFTQGSKEIPGAENYPGMTKLLEQAHPVLTRISDDYLEGKSLVTQIKKLTSSRTAKWDKQTFKERILLKAEGKGQYSIFANGHDTLVFKLDNEKGNDLEIWRTGVNYTKLQNALLNAESGAPFGPNFGKAAPAPAKPVDEKPADEKPADEKPADEKPADEKSEDTKKPGDGKPH